MAPLRIYEFDTVEFTCGFNVPLHNYFAMAT